MRKFLACCSLIIGFLHAGAQSLDSTLERYASNFQPEKAYLHYDKSAYFPGETIWFKAYIVEELYPAAGSRNFYVDWIADNGTVLSHTVSPIVDGSTNGQFDIPENYNGSSIHVRAYTKWMLNFDTAFLYSKDIRLLSKTPVGKTGAKIVLQPTLQFFPEGGDAISGVVNLIAFKANDQYGRPVKIKGTIVDAKGSFVDSIHSVHDGMGKFYLNPQPGIGYTAKWRDEKGIERTTSLPAAKASGVVLQVSQHDKKGTIIVSGSAGLPESLKQLHLIGTMSQRMAFKTDVALGEANSARRVIPTESLPTGILTVTVFDAAWNAVAERVIFVNNGGYSFQTSMEVNHWGMGKRKRNEISITVPAELQDADLSIAVTDAGIGSDSSTNIISQLLLSSDIRGYVHEPAFYFSGASGAEQYLDLVMLTNGWRRFKWEDVVKGKTPAINYPKDTSYLYLSGKLFGVAKSQLSGTDNIVLVVRKDTTTQMLIMPISTDGTFADPDIILFDTVQVYYSLKSRFLKEAEARFMTERLPAPNYTAFSKGFASADPFQDTAGNYLHARLALESLRLQEELRGKMMENVIVKAKQKTTLQLMDEKYASGVFSSANSYQFDLVNDPLATTYMNALAYLQGKVAGLLVNGNANPPTATWRGGTPSIFVDEMQSDLDMVSNIPVSDIAYIKVLQPPFIGAVGGGPNGAIAIYTRRGDDREKNAKGLTKNQVAGYTPIRQFYSPNYDRFDPKNQQPDVRTTLYWNPQVKTTAKKRTVTLSFYNNDVSQSFRVIVEGMSRDGLMTHFEQIME